VPDRPQSSEIVAEWHPETRSTAKDAMGPLNR
jgi:hypothetical protein